MRTPKLLMNECRDWMDADAHPWLCDETLREYFNYPKRAESLWAVVYKTKPRDASALRIDYSAWICAVDVEGRTRSLYDMAWRFVTRHNSTTLWVTIEYTEAQR